MSSPFGVAPALLKEISQTFLEMKKMARSLENGADALVPLTDDHIVIEQLNAITDHARHAAQLSTGLYNLIAREASQA